MHCHTDGSQLPLKISSLGSDGPHDLIDKVCGLNWDHIAGLMDLERPHLSVVSKVLIQPLLKLNYKKKQGIFRAFYLLYGN